MGEAVLCGIRVFVRTLLSAQFCCEPVTALKNKIEKEASEHYGRVLNQTLPSFSLWRYFRTFEVYWCDTCEHL